MQEQFGDLAKDKKFRLNSRLPTQKEFKRTSQVTSANNFSHSRQGIRSLSQSRSNFDERGVKQSLQTSKNSDKQSRNVRFSQKISNTSQTRKKHHSSSILKKTRFFSRDRRTKVRSDSINSLAGQNPHHDDQSCENTNLNKVIKQQYLSLLENFGETGNYVDDIFPPVISSLFSYAGRKKNKLPDFKWLRLADAFPESELVMWSSDLTKINIEASTPFAASYFLLAMNCIKNSKNLLRFMFESQQPNPQGVYFVKIFQGNIWKYIIIDDYIPVVQELVENKKTGEQMKIVKPAFLTIVNPSLSGGSLSSNKSLETIDIWPFLIEKAFAKVYSSYQALQNGNIYDFLEQVTNKPYQYINLDEGTKKLKDKLAKTNELIAFGQSQEDYRTALQIAGSSQKLMFTTENKQKKILRIEDLPNFFQGVYLFGTHSYSYYGHCPIRQTKESISVRFFQLKSATNCSLSILQKDEKYFQQNFKYEYSWIRVFLLQKEFNSGFRWIDGRYDNTKSLNIEAYLEAGEYYILAMPEWEKKVYDLNLIIRTKIPVRIDRRIYQQGIIEEGCTDLAQRFGKLNQHNNYICSYNCIHEAMGLIVENINNQRTKGFIRIVRSIQGLKCTQEIEPVNRQFKKNKMIEVKIKAGEHFTVVLMMKKGIDQQFFRNFDFEGQ